MDFLVQQAQRIARERAEMEAKGEQPPPLPDFLDPDKMMDNATDWVKDQFTTKEEKEAKSRKKREEIEERERKEREAAGPSLADMFSGFKFGSGARNPFYHLRGRGFGPDGEFIPPTIEDIKKHYDKPHQPPPVFDDEPEELMMQRYYYSQKAPGKYRGGARNPFYHLRGGEEKELNLRRYGDDYRNWGYDEDVYLDDKGKPISKEEYEKQFEPVKMPVEPEYPQQPQFIGDPSQFKPQPYDPNNPLMFMVGAGPLDDFIAQVGQHPATTDLLNKGAKWVGNKLADKAFDYLLGGIAHNPKGHTTRNNNLTKQTPRKKKFCGFESKKFEHEDYDPAKMHKFRAATCGGEPLSHGGRPAGAKNKQGYTRSGQFTEGRKQYGQSKKFRERIMGEGRQLQIMPEEDELVSKKENPVVDKIIHEPMDDGDIRAYFPKARVMRYADLADYDNIEEVLPTDKSYVFLLYQHRPNDGHFVCIMRYGKTIEFFCSYGSKIDGPLYWTPLPARQALGEGKPYLSMLLKKASKRFKAVHNPVAFQSKKDGVATCGAYCVMRVNQLVNHNQDLHEFIDWMEEIKKDTGLSYDEIAANYVNKR